MTDHIEELRKRGMITSLAKVPVSKTDGIICAATLADAAADPALTLDIARELLREAAEAIRCLHQYRDAMGGEAEDYPECSGDPKSCPENEGFGCCGIKHPEAQGKAVAWMVGGEVFTSEAEAVEAIMQWGPSGAIATPLYTAAPKVAGVTGPARYFCDGPDGHFLCDDLELARRVVNAYDKDDDWTITDTLTVAHAAASKDAEIKRLRAESVAYKNERSIFRPLLGWARAGIRVTTTPRAGGTEMKDHIEVLRQLLREAVPYLRDAGEPFEDDGSNEPLELSRRIEDALESDAALAAMGAQPEARVGGEVAVCCGRSECGGECGNEWRGTTSQIETLIVAMAENYEMVCDGGYYQPNEQERLILVDFAHEVAEAIERDFTTPPPSAVPEGHVSTKALREVVERFNQTIPTPMNRRGESTMRIEHFVMLMHEAKQELAALDALGELANYSAALEPGEGE